ncbi:sensor histidine kinase [Sphingomicrobium clamense]|uniref:histidine kinase n=1 Tax=Sphingomicrobium clamense TaxID=2851013 RepID=A0ABS6V7U5_9SPHN|nr:CHASE3 domain-containing protein [Sphingomicrobium sp. B8]MBW0145415.1 CHASE3 domain-containing protein [Sphingomicrobium sp. B8]
MDSVKQPPRERGSAVNRWWRSGPRLSSLVLLILISAAMSGIVYSLIDAQRAERDLRQQVETTSGILAELRELQVIMSDAETGQRGYVLTSDNRYLTPYLYGIEQAVPALESVEEKLEPIANADQRETLATLRRAVLSKLRELEMAVELVRENRRGEAVRLIETDTGFQLMATIRSSIEELESAEEEILAQAVSDTERIEARNTPILIMLGLLVLGLIVLGVWQLVRTEKAEIAARDAEQLRVANERADLLARELNHRVKNIFAVVSAVVGSTLRHEKNMAEAAHKVHSRIEALAIAHDVSQGALDRPIVTLDSLLGATLAPYDDLADRLTMDGTPVELSSEMASPMGMIVHELATNAVKYGAWEGEDGHVTVSWKVDRKGEFPTLHLTWREDSKAVTAPKKTGFGSTMIDMAVRQLGAKADRKWTAKGLLFLLDIPLAADAA